ncbi:class I SAM-dependent methyltransferase [Nocardiopsis dassonvillei]|uniref:class I SAM-dependent methyltransferase n=1 Tax=Nocardiopsis dassonvillei TaxID=2014 RepID=UPI001E63672E|nr:class I SAM-dependent methyltransferase [Nocardiopsis dassonvillei]
MPTIPPEGPRPSTRKPHRHRRVAESFGADAERYDRARPRYPDALVERVTDAAPGPDVVDVGCGTGIASRQFQAAGCRVLGVDPDERMAELARRLGVGVEVAAWEDWDPDGREFDAVVAAQAWHWTDPVAGAAKAARVLRPGGVLAAFWNVFELPPEVAQAFADVYQRVVSDSPFDPRGMTAQGRKDYTELLSGVADGIREAGGFGEPEWWRWDWEWSYTRDAWLDQMPTFGILTWVPPDIQEQVLEGVGAAVDGMGGAFTMRYATVAVAASRAVTTP